MVAAKSLIKLIKDFSVEVRAEGVQLKKVILFGSYARNEQHRFSDVDLALVADEFKGIVFFDLDLFMNVKIKKKYSLIQVQTFSTLHFLKGDPFINQIKKTGIEIV